MRADGHLYALLVALRDGRPPAAVVTVVADGTTQVEPVRPAVLATAADRVVQAMEVAAAVAAGEPARPGPALRPLPPAPDCPEGTAWHPAPPAGGAPGERDVGAADLVTARSPAAVDAALAAPRRGDVYIGWVAAAEVPPARPGTGRRGRVGVPRLVARPRPRPPSGGPPSTTTCTPPTRRPGEPPAALPPLEAVRAWMREAAGRRRPGRRLGRRPAADGDAAALAATAAAATRWLAGFVRVLGWPLPDGLTLLNVAPRRRASGPAPGGGPPRARPSRWPRGADARLGRVTGPGDFC